MHRHPLVRDALRLLAVAAALAAAPHARAQERIPPEWRLAPALGLETGLGDEKYSALKVRIEAERGIRALSPQARLSAVVSLGLSHPSGDETVPIAYDPYYGVQTADLAWDANVFELIPAARLTYARSGSVTFFADGGVGVAYTAARVTLPPALEAFGLEDHVEDGVAGVLRLAAGMHWAPTPRVRLGIEAAGLHVRFGGGIGSAFNLVASISHRL